MKRSTAARGAVSGGLAAILAAALWTLPVLAAVTAAIPRDGHAPHGAAPAALGVPARLVVFLPYTTYVVPPSAGPQRPD